MENHDKSFSKRARGLVSENWADLIRHILNPSLRVVVLMVLVTGLGYPILLVAIGDIALPFQSNGSLVTFDGKVIGSKLIAQEFKSDKLFHSRPAANSTSMVDPHITPEEANSQIARISEATGLPQSTLRTAIQLNVERNKVTNLFAFAPPYVNVLEVNLELLTGYPDIYEEFTSNRNMSTNEVT
jgi:K+-transporting ATPase ATPase C chain